MPKTQKEKRVIYRYRGDVQGPAGDVAELAKRVGSSMSRKISETLIDERDPLPDRNRFQITY